MKTITATAIAVLVSMFTILNAQVQEIQLEQTPGEFTTESLTLTPGDYQFTISNNNVGHDVGFVIVPKGQYEPSNHIKDAYVKAPVKTGSSSMTNIVNLPAGEYEYFCPMNKTPKYAITVKNEADGMMKKGESEKMMGKEQSGAMKKGEDKMMKKGEDKMMKKGEDKMMKKGEDKMMKKGEDKMMKKGEDTMMKKSKGDAMMKKDKVETIKLGQTPGKFNVQNLTVTEGTYQFEIANASVPHEVGFVLVPKGQYNSNDHIKAAYVTKTVSQGSSSLTGIVDLEAGEYEYFCPMNKTPKYSLTVVK